MKLDAAFRRTLSRTVTENNPETGKPVTKTFPCDLEGNELPFGALTLQLYQDVISGADYVRVAENIPSLQDTASKAEAERIQALKPVHYASPDGDVKGWFVLAPNFDAPAAVAPAVAAPAADAKPEKAVA